MNQTLDPAQLPLRDIHLPAAVPWWPPAFGWWILAAALLGIAIGLAVRLWRRRRHRAARRAFDAVLRALAEGAEPAGCAQEASIVLRRFAMSVSPPDADGVAGLVGDSWLEYLDGRAPEPAFADRAGPLLLETAYRPPGQVTATQVRELCRLCADWIEAQPVRA